VFSCEEDCCRKGATLVGGEAEGMGRTSRKQSLPERTNQMKDRDKITRSMREKEGESQHRITERCWEKGASSDMNSVSSRRSTFPIQLNSGLDTRDLEGSHSPFK